MRSAAFVNVNDVQFGHKLVSEEVCEQSKELLQHDM